MKLLKNITKIFSSNILGQLLSFSTFVIVSRELGPSQFGVLSTIMAIQLILIQVSSFGMSTGLPKHISKNQKKLESIIGKLLNLRLISIFITSLLGYLLLKEYLDEQSNEVHYLGAISIAVGSIYMFSQTILQSLGKYNSWAMSNIALNLLKLISVLIIVNYLNILNIKNIQIINIIVSLSLVYGIYLTNGRGLKWKSLDCKSNSDEIKKLIKLCSWIFISSIIVTLILRLDIIMLSYYLGNEDVGVYAVASQIANILALFTLAVNTVLIPEFSKIVKDKGAIIFINSILKFSPVLILVIVLFYFMSPVILMLFGEEYSNADLPLLVLVIAFSFGIIVNPISIVFYEADKSKMLFIMNFLQLIFNFILNIIFIPEYGLLGASVSTLFIKLFGALFIIVGAKIYGENIDEINSLQNSNIKKAK